jgi:nucleotide-binding universal stress UspA family protein
VTRNLLIATDGSELAGRAVAEGVGLAAAMAGGVVIVNVVVPLSSLGGRDEMFAGEPPAIRKAAVDYLLAESRVALETAARIAAAANVPCRTRQIEHDHAWRAILDAAKEEGCELIVMATHGRSGLSAVVLGSQTSKLLAHADRPVLVCR